MKNIFLENVARGIKYGVKPHSIKQKWKFNGDKEFHVNLLRKKYNLTIENIKAIKEQGEDSINGYYVEFSGNPKSAFPLKDFENSTLGIKLLNVKDSEDTLKATVYIPEKKEYKFNEKFDSYKNTLSAEKQKASDFVESIDDITAATLNSFWTSKAGFLPKQVPVWCELWVRYEITKKENLKYVRTATYQILQNLKYHIKNNL